METITKQCMSCSRPVKGRTDKKFCNDACRNNFNNRLNGCSNNYVRQVNHILQKNRRILASLMPRGMTHAKISAVRLQELGFLFKYYTHDQSNKKGNQYRFCYEYGYFEHGNAQFIIVHQELSHSP